MANINEIAPVIIDPSHARFGQVGEMTFSGWMGDGTCLIKFDDGEATSFNDGWLTGITQFAALPKEEPNQIARLTKALPELRPKLEEFYSQVVEPMRQPPTSETVAARRGAVALINSVIKPEQVSD